MRCGACVRRVHTYIVCVMTVMAPLPLSLKKITIISNYSETSDKGHSVVRTQYKKPLYKRQFFFAPNYNFPILLVYFQL